MRKEEGKKRRKRMTKIKKQNGEGYAAVFTLLATTYRLKAKN